MILRKVKIKKFIPYRSKRNEDGLIQQMPCTNTFESTFNTYGFFHQWGSKVEETENGTFSQTVAIVELSDGTIQQVIPDNMMFVDPYIFFKAE